MFLCTCMLLFIDVDVFETHWVQKSSISFSDYIQPACLLHLHYSLGLPLTIFFNWMAFQSLQSQIGLWLFSVCCASAARSKVICPSIRRIHWTLCSLRPCSRDEPMRRKQCFSTFWAFRCHVEFLSRWSANNAVICGAGFTVNPLYDDDLIKGYKKAWHSLRLVCLN